jgi:hypothetical protein
MLFGLCFLVALALAAACDGGEEERSPTAAATATASATVTATVIATPWATATIPVTAGLPEGFPEDFPLYENAITRVAGLVPEEGGFLVSMDTEDSPDQVRAFYERELAKAPWQVENVVEIAQEEMVVIEFARADGGEESGTVAIGTLRENGQHASIGISLTTTP